MYQASQAYLEQMMQHGTRRRLSGLIGSVAFTGNDVILDSFSITGRATEESDTKIGGVFLGQLEMTLLPSFITKIPKQSYRGKEVSVSIGLWIPNDEIPAGGYWEDIPCGVFTLEAPKISKEGITVSGYDHMAKFDKKFNINATSATPYGYLYYASQACGVALGQTEAEIQELPNGTELLGLYSPNDIETFRDLIYWVAQACGCFACCDRSGNLVLRKFGTSNSITIDEMHRDNDVVFSGYTTKWTGISFIDIETQYTRYYGLEVDDGLTMNMGANPLLQLGSATAVERRRRAVLNAVAQIQYTPFYFNSARDPIFDLGDEIPFTGGISGDSTGCIMAYSYAVTGFNFEGYGDDPALANARSKSDKNISGLMQSTVENEVTYYNYANTEPINIVADEEISLASIRFISAQETTVKILHEFMFDIVQDLAVGGYYELHYYLDEELLSYMPAEALGAISQRTEGDDTNISICRDYFYILKNVVPNVLHTWEVKVVMHDVNSALIQRNHAHVTIEGQRLYGEEYEGGYIEAKDYLTIIPFGNLGLVSISDAAEITPSSKWWHGEDTDAEDKIQKYDINEISMLSITDDFPTIVMKRGFPWLTEDGGRWLLENGDRWFTE